MILQKLGMTESSIDKDAHYSSNEESEKSLEQIWHETKQENIQIYKNNTTFSVFNKEQSTMDTLNKIPKQLKMI